MGLPGFEVSRFRSSEVRDPGVRRFDAGWTFPAAVRLGKAGVQHPASQTAEPRNPGTPEPAEPRNPNRLEFRPFGWAPLMDTRPGPACRIEECLFFFIEYRCASGVYPVTGRGEACPVSATPSPAALDGVPRFRGKYRRRPGGRGFRVPGVPGSEVQVAAPPGR
jgi:hypothetical protein